MALTNGDIVDLCKTSGKPYCVTLLKEQYLTNGLPVPSLRSLERCVNNVMTEHGTLLKSRSRVGFAERMSTYREQYVKQCQPPPEKKRKTNKAAAATETTGESSMLMADAYLEAASGLAKELNASLDEKAVLQEQLENTRKSNHRLYQYQIDMRQRHVTIKAENKNLHYKASKAVERAKELKRTSMRENYQRHQNDKLRDHIGLLEKQKGELDVEIASLKQELQETKVKFHEEREENEWLRDLVQNDVLQTKVGGHFTEEVQTCVYSLLQSHVSTSQIRPVITAVLKLVHHEVTELPSRSTILNMNIQRLSLAQQQLGEEFVSKPNTTLLSDETTKYDTKMEGIHASDADGRLWVLGLRELLTKSASDVYDVFQEILSDIDVRCHITTSDKSRQILANISARLSDRAATELKLGQLIEDARLEILPLVRDGWHEMAEEDQLAAGRLLVFTCGLHGLVHFAEAAGSALAEAEKAMFNGDVPAADPFIQKHGETATVRLVRTTCKAFSRGGDERNGVHLQFMAYVKPFLKQHKLLTLPLAPFRGNRFNILFANASHIFFLRTQMVDFLEGSHANRLLQAVLKDLKTPEFMAGCKSLGLISKFVSTPLWHVIEDKNIHVLDMSPRYQQLVDCLEKASANIPAFMAGNVLPFGESTPVNRDCVLDELLKPWEHDDMVQVMLSMILPALSKLSQKLYQDHLDGGQYAGQCGEELYAKTSSVPKHNKFAESVFAYVDMLMRSKPNISTLACEAYVMFVNNRTLEWLQNKSSSETATILSTARKETKKIRATFKERHEHILQERKKAQMEKVRKAEELRLKKLKELEKYTDGIIEHGLWQSEAEVDNMLESYPTQKGKLEALKAQLKFRQFVLKQEAGKENLFAFSTKDGEKRRNLSTGELATNLKRLVTSASRLPQDHDKVWVGRRVKHRFKVEGPNGQTSLQWCTGKVISQVSQY